MSLSAIGLCARALGCNAIDIGCCSCVACNSASAVARGITIGPYACSIDQRASAMGARAVAGAPDSEPDFDSESESVDGDTTKQKE